MRVDMKYCGEVAASINGLPLDAAKVFFTAHAAGAYGVESAHLAKKAL
jgi:hypothetical protein